MKKLLLTEYRGVVLTALWEDKRPLSFRLEPRAASFHTGDIWLGSVQKVNRNIEAAFVALKDGQNGYLPYTAGQEPRPGDVFPVQITTEALKTKLPVLSRGFTLPGRYLVLLSDRFGISFSKKIEDAAVKERIRELLRPYVGEVGFIVRTNGPEASEEELRREAEALSGKAERLFRRAEHAPVHSLLLAGDPQWMKELKDAAMGEIDEIVTDIPAVYEELESLKQGDAALCPAPLRLYEDTAFGLKKLYGLESALEAALQRKIWLRSGAYLLIEQTETLTAIDVNSGKTDWQGDFEKTAFSVNCEAAAAIAYELRLRNLSGMFLIDFISMKDKAHQEELLCVLSEAVRKDPVQTEVLDMTKLGLVEMTRRKTAKSLAEQLEEVEKIQKNLDK